MGVDHKLFLQLFLIGFCLFCSKTGKKKIIEFSFNLSFLLSKSSLTAGMFLRVLSNPFFKSKIPLGYPKILMIVSLIIT